MRQAAQFFLGEHDFSAFRSTTCSAPSPFKTIRELTIFPIHARHATLCIEIEANSFLQHMVRIIVGTLIEVGVGRWPPEVIPTLLEQKDRQKSGKTAPPEGLYVLKVIYAHPQAQWSSEVLDE